MKTPRSSLPPSFVISSEGQDDAYNKTLKKIEDLRKEFQAEQGNEGNEEKEKVYSSTFPTPLSPEDFHRKYHWYNPDLGIESEHNDEDNDE